MPAAALTWKPGCGRETQLKIWIGSTVNGLCRPAREKSGRNATYVRAPMVISGAVSPTARDSARMVPVRMPGSAAGTTTRLVTCQRVAPSA